jgi:hypothetical protein
MGKASATNTELAFGLAFGVPILPRVSRSDPSRGPIVTEAAR